MKSLRIPRCVGEVKVMKGTRPSGPGLSPEARSGQNYLQTTLSSINNIRCTANQQVIQEQIEFLDTPHPSFKSLLCNSKPTFIESFPSPLGLQRVRKRAQTGMYPMMERRGNRTDHQRPAGGSTQIEMCSRGSPSAASGVYTYVTLT